MTLRVVADNTNVARLPVDNVNDLGGMLRLLADDIDAGEYGEVISLVTLVVRSDGIGILTYGENCSPYELMGIFEAGKLRVFADDAVED